LRLYNLPNEQIVPKMDIQLRKLIEVVRKNIIKESVNGNTKINDIFK